MAPHSSLSEPKAVLQLSSPDVPHQANAVSLQGLISDGSSFPSRQVTLHAFVPLSLCTYYSFCLEHRSLSFVPSEAYPVWMAAQRPLLWESPLKALAALASDRWRDSPTALPHCCSTGCGSPCVGLSVLQALGGRVCASIQLLCHTFTSHALHARH